jgi:hypothetical protein
MGGLGRRGHLSPLGGPKTAKEFAGGMVYIVSGLKTFLEPGPPIAIGAG